MLPSSYEQPVSITEREIQQFDEVDEVIDSSLIIGEPDKIFEFGLYVKRTAAITSYVLAKLLWRLKNSWDSFSIEGEFVDVVYERLGTPAQTTRKYVNMWESIFENPEIPEATKYILMGRPIRDTLLLTASAKEGMTPDELRNAALAPDQDTLRDLINKARGEQTSSSNALFLTLVLREDDTNYPRGTLLCRRGRDGAVKAWGIFKVDDTDPDVSQAIARTMSVGIREK